jgi:hypothetical protein
MSGRYVAWNLSKFMPVRPLIAFIVLSPFKPSILPASSINAERSVVFFVVILANKTDRRRKGVSAPFSNAITRIITSRLPSRPSTFLSLITTIASSMIFSRKSQSWKGNVSIVSTVFPIVSTIFRWKNGRFRNCPYMCHLYDYGISGDGYQLIMSLYPISLRQWRISQVKAAANEAGDGRDRTALLATFFSIYNDVLCAVNDLHANHCVHFDLKCDNVLIRSISLPPSTPPRPSDLFQIALADFGESLMWNPLLGEDGNSLIGRGTENIQSPEILSLTTVAHDGKPQSVDGSTKTCDKQLISTGADVWALGCFFYELLTGEYLFEEKHGMPIFFQVRKNRRYIHHC